jgi:hypothetical protein
MKSRGLRRWTGRGVAIAAACVGLAIPLLSVGIAGAADEPATPLGPGDPSSTVVVITPGSSLTRPGTVSAFDWTWS